MMKQNQEESRAKAQKRKDFMSCCGGIFWKRAFTRTMIFAGLFLLLGVVSVSAKQPLPASTLTVAQPTGTPGVTHPQSPGISTSTGTQSVPGPVAGNQTMPQSSMALPHARSGASTAKDIRDIRGPLHIPDPLTWLIYGAVGICLLLASVWFWKWLRRRKTEREKLPFELALEQLERARSFMKPESANKFSVMVSEAVRNYIEKRFDMEVTRHTTEEFMRRLAADPSGEIKEHQDLLNGFLGYCDLAKFARYALGVRQMEEMLESALHFVDATRFRPEDQTEGGKMKKGGPSSREKPAGKNPSVGKRWWEKGLGFISKKTALPTDLDHGHAVAEGGR